MLVDPPCNSFTVLVTSVAGITPSRASLTDFPGDRKVESEPSLTTEEERLRMTLLTLTSLPCVLKAVNRAL